MENNEMNLDPNLELNPSQEGRWDPSETFLTLEALEKAAEAEESES